VNGPLVVPGRATGPPAQALAAVRVAEATPPVLTELQRLFVRGRFPLFVGGFGLKRGAITEAFVVRQLPAHALATCVTELLKRQMRNGHRSTP
jgi:hypothetical protein